MDKLRVRCGELAVATPRDRSEYKTWLQSLITCWQEYMRRGLIGTAWCDLYRSVQAVAANGQQVGILDALPRLQLRPPPQGMPMFDALVPYRLRQIAHWQEPVLRYLSKCIHACNAIGNSATAAKPNESEGNGGADAAPGQEQLPLAPTRESVLRQLEPAVRKAYLAYQYVETANGRRMEDREAYEWLREYGIDQGKGDLGELTDYQLPDAFDTFRRYVTDARKPLGESKYTRREGRKHGGSVARQDEIECHSPDNGG
ncbi:MAG: hypothetical protein ABSG86_04415 [Thermoguttaceae bacterium]|jgi:hypothetical protein